MRWSPHYYATCQRLKEQQKVELGRPEERADAKLARHRLLLGEALETHPSDESLMALEHKFENFSETLERKRDADLAAQRLLGPLASAGLAALALEHESRKEMQRARQLTRNIRRIGKELDEPRVTELGDQIRTWVDRIEEARRLFAPLLNGDERGTVEPLSARAVLNEVVRSLRPLVSGPRFTLRIPVDIYFPAATFAEWNSLL